MQDIVYELTKLQDNFREYNNSLYEINKLECEKRNHKFKNILMNSLGMILKLTVALIVFFGLFAIVATATNIKALTAFCAIGIGSSPVIALTRFFPDNTAAKAKGLLKLGLCLICCFVISVISSIIDIDYDLAVLIIFGLIGIGLSTVVLTIKRIFVYNKSTKHEQESEISRLRSKSYGCSSYIDTCTVLPMPYKKNEHAINAILRYLETGRADNLKEAINLYENEERLARIDQERKWHNETLEQIAQDAADDQEKHNKEIKKLQEKDADDARRLREQIRGRLR